MGAFSELLLTYALAHIFTKEFHLYGAIRPFAETLLYSGFDHLNFTRIFVASVFVASSSLDGPDDGYLGCHARNYAPKTRRRTA
jgi:hypothetical protein